MIVSHAHRFVFVKGHKVASTSIEIALAQICGPDDIITPITPIDERLRLAGGGVARNYSDDPAAEQAYAEAIATRATDDLGEMPRKVTFRNHMSLRNILRAVPDARDYRIVFAERSPYEKVLSIANWRRGLRSYNKGGSLSQTTDGLIDKVAALIADGSVLTARNIDIYKNEEGCVPSEGWRFETLPEQLAAFFAELGTEPIAMPHAKQGLGLKASEVNDLLSPDQIAYINDAFAEEFETFGYARVA